MAGSLVVTAGVVALAQVREAFGIAIPSLEELEIVLAVSVTITVVSELVKAALRRREQRLGQHAGVEGSS